MRTVSRALLLSAGLVLVSAVAARADSPYPVTSYYHDPNDLKAYTPPGPGPGTDGTGLYLVEPPKVLEQARLNDPNEVKWPTLDKSEWEKLKGQYKILPNPHQ